MNSLEPADELLHKYRRSWGGVTLAPFVNISVSKILISQKCLLHSLNLIHIWKVSPQLSCGDTCQIWTWYSIANMYFDDVEKLGKLRKGGNRLSYLQPWAINDWYSSWLLHSRQTIIFPSAVLFISTVETANYSWWPSRNDNVNCIAINLVNGMVEKVFFIVCL